MRVCPKCGHQDSIYWRPAFTDMEMEIVEPENFANIDPQIYGELMAHPSAHIETGAYVFRLTKTKKWVQRLWLPIYEGRGRTFRKPKGIGRGKKRLVGLLEAIGVNPARVPRGQQRIVN